MSPGTSGAFLVAPSPPSSLGTRKILLQGFLSHPFLSWLQPPLCGASRLACLWPEGHGPVLADPYLLLVRGSAGTSQTRTDTASLSRAPGSRETSHLLHLLDPCQLPAGSLGHPLSRQGTRGPQSWLGPGCFLRGGQKSGDMLMEKKYAGGAGEWSELGAGSSA